MEQETVLLQSETSSKYQAFNILQLQKYLVQIVKPIMAGHPEELGVVMEHLNSAEIRVLEQGRRLQLNNLSGLMKIKLLAHNLFSSIHES